MTTDAADLVANEVHHRLSQIRLHRADVPRLEGVEPPKYVEYRFLHQIAGIELAARCGRKLAVGPASQLRQAALEQRLDGSPIAVLRPHHELNRRLVAQ